MALLEVNDLCVDLPSVTGTIGVLRNVRMGVDAGETVGLIGESGSGKSMSARSVMRLLPPGARVRGEILFDGASVLSMQPRRLRAFRANDVAMIHQDPRAHINPVRKVGDFLLEGMLTTAGLSRRAATARAVALLQDVGIPDAQRRMRQYPHELSGGLLQRVMIAASLSCRPRLLLADEPSTALDVTTQSDVMAVLMELRDEYQLSILFITHDVDLAVAVCDRVAVMLDGEVVEECPAGRLYQDAQHEYTRRLMAARPSMDTSAP